MSHLPGYTESDEPELYADELNTKKKKLRAHIKALKSYEAKIREEMGRIGRWNGSLPPGRSIVAVEERIASIQGEVANLEAELDVLVKTKGRKRGAIG